MILPNNELYLNIIHGLVDNGWCGSWTVENDEIVIHETPETNLETQLQNKPLAYHDALRLAICIGNNLASLHQNNISILFLHPSDISIIDENWYIINNLDRSVPIIKKNTIMLSKVVSLKGEIPPELQNIKSLPFVTDISSVYYSSALLIRNAMKIGQNMDEIADSSLYFFLKRCLINEHHKRRFLCV
jgi:hypothetical protein